MASVALTGAVWVPFLADFNKMMEREPAPVEVAWIPDDSADTTKPDEIPPPDEKKDTSVPKEKPRRIKPQDQPPPEPAKVEEPKKKEAELQIKPPPPPEKKPPPPQPEMDHRKQMVDQDKFEDEKDNPDANFLAQKNHRTEHETRAKATNLVRNVESEKAQESEQSQNKDQESGMKEQKVAELQNRDGAKNQVVRSSPMQGQEGKAPPKENQPQGPLSMRDLTPKAAIDPVEQQKAREGLDKQEQAAGELPMARVGVEGQRQVAKRMGSNMPNLRLNNHTFDEIEGVQHAEDERRQAAKAEKSHVAGHWDKVQSKMAALRSSLENFTPFVKPGNQEELGTRASPFAAYITAMHRQIHKIFTDGFLASIEMHHNSEYDDSNLWTQLEIVLKPDGSVDQVLIVRTSGLTTFDTAAIGAVVDAAPFPPPPEVIKSVNGKVYLDWQFHRNELACGTFNVDPHILSSVDERIVHDTSVTGQRGLDAAKAASKAGGKPGHASSELGALAGLGGNAPSGGGSVASREPQPESEAPSHEEPSGGAQAGNESGKPPAPEVTEESKQTAVRWFENYQRGDVGWLAGLSALPFMASGEVVARDAPTLKSMYKQMLAEAKGHGITGVEVMTSAQMQSKLGMMPPGGEADTMVFAIGKTKGDEIILLMKKSDHGWRVAGIDRR